MTEKESKIRVGFVIGLVEETNDIAFQLVGDPSTVEQEGLLAIATRLIVARTSDKLRLSEAHTTAIAQELVKKLKDEV